VVEEQHREPAGHRRRGDAATRLCDGFCGSRNFGTRAYSARAARTTSSRYGSVGPSPCCAGYQACTVTTRDVPASLTSKRVVPMACAPLGGGMSCLRPKRKAVRRTMSWCLCGVDGPGPRGGAANCQRR
jgi:hypothetical protein